MAWRRKIDAATPLLDEAYLERLGAALGGPALAELLADGMIELEDRLSRLEVLARSGDREAAAALCHDIVAVAGHMGLGALSAAAAALNRRLRSPRRVVRQRGAPQAIPGDADLPRLVSGVTALGAPSMRALSARTGVGSTRG